MSHHYVYEDSPMSSPFSPASSTSSMSTTESVSSDASPVPSPASPQTQDDPQQHHNYQHNYPRYKNCYEERLQPVPAFQTVPTTANQTFPKPTHRSEYNTSLQERFNTAVQNGIYQELDTLLRGYSEMIDINQFDEQGQTPLQHFCSSGNLALVQLLVKFGADPRLCSRDGWSTLHIAAWSGHSELMMYIMRCSKR